MAVRTADGVEPLHRFVHILAQAIEVAHLVEHACRAAFLTGAVVGHRDEDGVVQLPQPRQRVDVATEVVVGVVEEGRKGFLQPRGEQP